MELDDIIYVTPSHYVITNVNNVPSYISNNLSKWDPVYFRKDEIGYHYDKINRELRIPRGYPLPSLKYTFLNHTVKEDNAQSGNTIDIALKNPPRNYIQEHTLAFMLGREPYTFTRPHTQLYVDLDTGEGKTFCGIATICYFKLRSIIFIPPISKVADQWIASVQNFTTLNRSEYLYVTGSEMCEDILNGKYDNVKIFIMPRSTVLAYVRKYDGDWRKFSDLMKYMNLGIKIVDEAHMDFSTIVNIDCYTDISKTYYMSSSPSRSDKVEKIIYYKIFKGVPKYGKELKSKEQNHIIPFIVNFKSTPTPEQLAKVKTRYGTSLAKYGDYLLDEAGARDEFIDAYTYAMYTLLKFRRNGGKILVICITIEFAKELRDITKSLFPFLTTGLFVGSGKDKNKELDNDVVFSTVKSMGTGSEIVNHQLTINTITYASDIMADQISGRIRKQEGRKAIYCELVNINHSIARKHFEERKPYLIKKAKNGKMIMHTITDEDIAMVDNYFRNKYRFNDNGMLLNRYGNIIIPRNDKE